MSQQIELGIDPDANWYTGRTEIEVEIAAATSTIWLNGHDLRVFDATVTPAGGSAMRADYTEHDGSGFASVRTLEQLPMGKARIALRFGAKLGDGDHGLYVREDEEKKRYAFTQLEPISARAVFPCFDEPGFKIPFEISVVVPRGMQAVSNGRELSRTPHAAGDRVQFATTAKLPVYLVTIAVGAFEIVDVAPAPMNAVRSRSLPLRAFTPRATAKAAGAMMEVVAPLLAELEAYTGISYPYEKLDIIVELRKPGAMEGAGAITMGSFLLPDEDNPSDFFRFKMIEILSHELAHMWVGNLVTLAWWDDVWLNEGFATWLGAKAAQAWDPSLRADLSLRVAIDSRLEQDDVGSMRAIREPIRTLDDIQPAFDRVVYDKGAGVLAMFEQWAGADAWQRGLRGYLQWHRDGHATTADFAKAMSAAVGADIGAALDTFLNQRGAPVVSFALRCPAGGASAHIAMKQSAAAPLGTEPTPTAKWRVPICVRYGGKAGGSACTLLADTAGELPLPAAAGCPAWILPNASGAGYYRSSLGRTGYAALREHGLQELTDDEQSIYVDGLLADYRRGALAFGDALDIMHGKPARLDPHVIAPLKTLLWEARGFLADGPLQARVERHARELFGPALRPLGYDDVKGEARERDWLRWQLIDALAEIARDETVRREGRRRAQRYFAGGGAVDSSDTLGSFRDAALRIAGEEADGTSVDVMLRAYEDPPSRVAQLAAKTALMNVQRPEAVRSVLASEFVESIAGEQMLEVMTDDGRGSSLAVQSWRWLSANDAALLRSFIEREDAWHPTLVVERLCDDRLVTEAEQLLRQLVTNEADQRGVADAVARARRCVAARKVHEPEMRAYFQSK